MKCNSLLFLPTVEVGEEGMEAMVAGDTRPVGGALGGALLARAEALEVVEALEVGEAADPLPLVPPQVSRTPKFYRVVSKISPRCP